MQEENLKVIIVRQPSDPNGAEYPINKIHRVIWDNVSGGVKKHSGNYHLYGYIPYSDAASIGISCSGRHNRNDNYAKVCILDSANSMEPNRTAYLILKNSAGEKPKGTANYNRPKGYGPCTKTIIRIVENSDNGYVYRGELRQKLLEIGYASVTIRNALRTLQAQHRCLFIGSAFSKYQKILPLGKDA